MIFNLSKKKLTIYFLLISMHEFISSYSRFEPIKKNLNVFIVQCTRSLLLAALVSWFLIYHMGYFITSRCIILHWLLVDAINHTSWIFWDNFCQGEIFPIFILSELAPYFLLRFWIVSLEGIYLLCHRGRFGNLDEEDILSGRRYDMRTWDSCTLHHA